MVWKWSIKAMTWMDITTVWPQRGRLYCPTACLSKRVAKIRTHKAVSYWIASQKSNRSDRATGAVALALIWRGPAASGEDAPACPSTNFHLRQIKIDLIQVLTSYPYRPANAHRQLSRSQKKVPFNPKYTQAKRFVLIKIHLEAMTSTRPLCLSICSSFADLFCVWKLNS